MASATIHPKAHDLTGRVIPFKPDDGQPHIGVVTTDGAEIITSDPNHFRALAAKLVEVAHQMATAEVPS